MRVHISSVFGQVEAFAADILIRNGKAKRIEVKDFPERVPVINDAGIPVRFAILLPNRAALREFDDLIARLRA